MASPEKAKGDRAELAVVKHLQAHGFPNARRGKAGAEKDLGDIFGVRDRDGDDWTIQVADRVILGREHGAVVRKAREADEQSERAGTLLWCLVVKRAGCADVGDWFVWLPAWMMADTYNSPFRVGSNGYGPEFDDLTCVTVRTWLALVAPEPAWTEPAF